ncbi:hypothetical protein BX604_3195 [Burkholderia sp. JKS000303]|nr:hypothetical protein BX604_3195 [Burkholderia sp. JKS000303]
MRIALTAGAPIIVGFPMLRNDARASGAGRAIRA